MNNQIISRIKKENIDNKNLDARINKPIRNETKECEYNENSDDNECVDESCNANNDKAAEQVDNDFFVEQDSRWSNVRNFTDLLKINQKFIEGEIQFSPYSGIPLQIQTSKVRQKLSDLHKYGLLITDRQDAVCTYKYKPTYENRLYDIEQRGYLRFYMDYKNDTFEIINSFLENLKNEEIMFCVFNLSTQNFKTNLPEDMKELNVTKIRDVVTENNLSLTNWKCAANIDFENEVESYLWNNSIIDKLLKKSVHFILMTSKYGEGDLEKIVMNIFSKISQVPLYDQKKINNSVVNDISRWLYVRNYTDLLKLNIQFIEGSIKETPYHHGPLENPSAELVKNLIKLHEYGILTVNGQEAICQNGLKLKHNNEWCDVEQRGFLEFHVDYENKKLAESFLKFIKQTELIYSIIDMKTCNTITNISRETKRYNVTRDRSCKKKKDLKVTPWRYYTNLNYNIKQSDNLWTFNDNPEINKILKNTIHFMLAMPEYGKGNLEEKLLDMCDKSGAKT